ncbi:hypothetical protein [Deinococcus sp. Leaf326]|uniref:hypothetical protein n=1 Tax=Deinococcus sp. Leaf326 TaxID=1736338 RepID=UPI0006FE9D3D|nr:hypothetical protein [Deinococcus sp. Leaf326]KQR15645.1 hypothetical protein ASF71_08405 [Deinococcus sp. Leaf326]
MPQLRLEELMSYFVLAQAGDAKPYTDRDFVRLIDELGLERANALRSDIAAQLAQGRPARIIEAELVA